MKDSVYLVGFLLGAAVLLILSRDQLPSSIVLTWGLTFGATTAAAVLLVSLYRVQVELKHSRNQLARQDAELAFAKQVQRALFPAELPRGYGMDFSAVCIPALGISGDYYDIIEKPPEEALIVVADVSGKGIPAAILMANLQARLHALTESIHSLAELSGKLNRDLYKVTEPNKFATAFLASWRRDTGTLSYVNAGHLTPIMVGSEAPSLHCGGPPLGMFEETEYEMGQVRLAPGDLMAVYSDGIPEATSPSGEEFGFQRLEELVRPSRRDESLETIQQRVIGALGEWAKADRHDDITLVLMRVRES